MLFPGRKNPHTDLCLYEGRIYWYPRFHPAYSRKTMPDCRILSDHASRCREITRLMITESPDRIRVAQRWSSQGFLPDASTVCISLVSAALVLFSSSRCFRFYFKKSELSRCLQRISENNLLFPPCIVAYHLLIAAPPPRSARSAHPPQTTLFASRAPVPHRSPFLSRPMLPQSRTASARISNDFLP